MVVTAIAGVLGAVAVPKFLDAREVSEAKAAIAKGGLMITHNNQVMYLWPSQIKELKPSSKVFKSKTGGKDYQLIDIKFVPDDPRQEKLI